MNKDKDTIIDGRNRWMIAYDLGFTPDKVPMEVFEGEDEDIPGAILSLNLFRRHLTEDQRVALNRQDSWAAIESRSKRANKSGESRPCAEISRGKAYSALKSLERGPRG